MSLTDSKDVIEQLYSDAVLKYFPNYEVFWRQFIGNPNAEKPEPYTYNYPQTMRDEEKEVIQERYEKVQITHYSIFCQLAGSHFQLEELKASENIKYPKAKYFRHWEHFEVGYLHLGSVLYMLQELWNIIIKLKCVSREKFGETFLISRNENVLAQKLKEIQEDVKTIRDLMVHRGRAFTSFHHKEKFYIPLKVNKNMLWSQSINAQEMIETSKKLEEDILETEKLLNELHILLISDYEDFIKTKNIQIDYGVKK